ncbi:MAG TPA: tetratricopeptide repeat protein [Edaphobacter sp.]|nr:tetratricopeptide repeat protein [Edaphobacter sp.]
MVYSAGFLSSLALLVLLQLFTAQLSAQRTISHEQARELDHENPAWQSIRAHLPDPTAATAERLESAADILRARRFFEDAMDYYSFALQRGGEPVRLLNKMGVTELELRDISQARAIFQKAVKVNKKNAEAWNNLGVIEYVSQRYDQAIGYYKRASKLDKTSAIYHSNLGTVLFDKKEYERARKEFDTALKLDPEMLQHHSSLGVTSRMLSPADHARYCFELARLYLQRGDEQAMMHYLTTAAEAGFDIVSAMNSDQMFAPYRKDPRILVIVKNAQELRSKNNVAEGAGPPPPLPPDKH